MNVSLAVAGIVAAGVGLLTMHTAFTPLPKPGVPVVIASSRPAPTRTAWRHAEAAAKPALGAVSEPADDEDAAPALRSRPAVMTEPHQTPLPAVAESGPTPAPAPAMTPIAVNAVAPAAKPPLREVASADMAGQKMCKAPSPQPPVLSARSLQPALVLRYDAKARQIDIPPPEPSADNEQRRLRLSALFANILAN